MNHRHFPVFTFYSFKINSLLRVISVYGETGKLGMLGFANPNNFLPFPLTTGAMQGCMGYAVVLFYAQRTERIILAIILAIFLARQIEGYIYLWSLSIALFLVCPTNKGRRKIRLIETVYILPNHHRFRIHSIYD
jgi:hypothetical protein